MTIDSPDLKATPEQLVALTRKFEISPDGAATFEEFKARAHNDNLMGCIMLPWCGMWLGIETDGHTHS